MTQLDVKDFLLLSGNNCYLYYEKTKEDGVYYFIRNSVTKKIAVVYPVKKGTYTPAGVCHICTQLSVALPEYAKSMQKAVEKAKERAKLMKEDIMNRILLPESGGTDTSSSQPTA